MRQTEPRRNINVRGKRKDLGGEGNERSAEPQRKKMRQMTLLEPKDHRGRYAEFGEEDEFEIYDWEGKMIEYKKDLEDRERKREEKQERARKMEKSWELMRLCRK